jgi:signal transduction histidine kinase
MSGFFDNEGAGPRLAHDCNSERRGFAENQALRGRHAGLGTGIEGESVLPSAAVAAGIAHDLGNHLQIIASALNQINRGLDAASAAALRPLVRAGLSSLARASSLCRTLSGSGRDGTCDEVTSFSRILATVRDLVALVTGPAITLEFLAAEETPLIFCNALALEHCILNLVGNATDAMPNGGRLTLEVYREIRRDPPGATAGGESNAVLRVTDTGCGMSPDTLERIFLPFFTTRSTGTGLGLANVHNFVAQAGGTIEVSSSSDAGTTVLVRLPEWRASCHSYE